MDFWHNARQPYVLSGQRGTVRRFRLTDLRRRRSFFYWKWK